MRTRPYLPSILLIFQGLLLMSLGLYFIFIRPVLLPEDSRYMGVTLTEIQTTLPGLLVWLRRVFWVMGGFMFGTGFLILYLAQTTLRASVRSAALAMAIASFSSIGWMTVVNFMIDSDFKWLLLSFNLPWMIALILSSGARRQI